MMNTFGRYLEYKLRKALPQTLIIAALSIAITLTAVNASQRIRSYESVSVCSTGMWSVVILLGIYTFLFPFLETWELRNRRHIDTIYSFPIERRLLAAAHYLSGALQMFVAYTVTFFSGFFMLCIRTDYFDLAPLLGMYAVFLPIGLVLYSLVICVMQIGNNVFDSPLISLLYILSCTTCIQAPFIALYRLGILSSDVIHRIGDWWLNPYNMLLTMGNYFITFAERNKYDYHVMADKQNRILSSQWYHLLIWGILGIAAVVGYFFLFCRKRPEKIGGISDSWFGYKLLIPLSGYCGLLSYSFFGIIFYPDTLAHIILIVFYVVCMVIGYVIYRRGFRFRRSDWICLACAAIPLVIGCFVPR